MKILILAVGKTSTPYITEGVDNYLKRAARYMPVALQTVADVKSTKSLSEESQKQKEAAAILEALQPGDRVILLDEHGKELTSREFSDFISLTDFPADSMTAPTAKFRSRA